MVAARIHWGERAGKQVHELRAQISSGTKWQYPVASETTRPTGSRRQAESDDRRKAPLKRRHRR